MRPATLIAALATALGLTAGSLAAQEPYETPEGRACIQAWVNDTETRLNGYSGDKEFNARKPWTINRYGLFVGRKMKSVYEPDNWAQLGASRDSWMWLSYTSELAFPDWGNANFNGARVRGLHDFVNDCLGGTTTGGGATPGTPTAGAGLPTGLVSPGDACPSSLSGFTSYPGIVVGCWCAAGDIGGTVWGSQPYTADSALCSAAVHAGTIPASGGAVWAKITPGLDAYSGTARNGITTSDYGTYGASVTILGAAPASFTPQIAACPIDMSGQTEALTCFCSADRLSKPGSVWGSGTYTDDSDICAAARHAGAVALSGGEVTAVPVPDAGSYTGSTRNGVVTSDYGAWRGAFIFR